MTSIISLFVILTVSVLITRIATVSLIHTGLSREFARFQARSAFTGVGFTTTEAEDIVNHPVRRRIVMVLMLLGNAGIVSVIASVLLTFLKPEKAAMSVPVRILTITGGLAVLWLLVMSSWVDKWLSRLISKALNKWTDLEIRDYANLLHLSGEYQVTEMEVQPQDWLADKTLGELSLRQEGIMVIGIQRSNGGYVGVPDGTTKIEEGDLLILYGREWNLAELDERIGGAIGDDAHHHAVREQKDIEQKQHEEDEQRRKIKEEEKKVERKKKKAMGNQ